MVENFDIFSFEYDQKSRKKSLRWDVSEMMRTRFHQECQRNTSFYKVFNPQFNLTKPFFKEVKFRTSGERNLIIEVTGATGSGKSIVSLSMALNVMGKPVVVDDICFTTDDLLKRAMEIGQSHALIQDEQINQLGVGSQREQYERQTLEDTTRKFGLSILFCSPTTREHTTAHYNLKIICRNNRKRLTKVAILAENGSYMGYFVIKVLGSKNKLWVAYEEKKDAFIKEILSRSTKRLSIDDMSEALSKNKLFVYAKTRQEMKIVCTKMFPTLTGEEISMVVDNLRMLERMKGEDQ